MALKFKEKKTLNLTEIAKEIRSYWFDNHIFEKSLKDREGQATFTFYEGPPSANGKPGIHHALGRTIKDLFCRYKTMQGYQVRRQGGWDTHGLPVELQVENRLGIKKDDIGKTISVAHYNAECRRDVMQFQGNWEELTQLLGFWLDLENPYITYHPDYIQSLWWLFSQLWNKGLVYQGYTIQPYSPAAGTGLSSHELNQPGTYKGVKDTSVTAQFWRRDADEFLLAWTTTPWTLPSNSALAVGEEIDYLRVDTFNPYTAEPIRVVLAENCLPRFFSVEGADMDMHFEAGQKQLPYRIAEKIKGRMLVGARYEQLLPYVQPADEGDPFRVIAGDFVTTEEGTGIVHIAPTFGADDMRVAKDANIPPITVADPENPDRQIPLVDKEGRFVAQMGEFARRYVKNYTDDPDYQSVDVDIAVKLKKENRAFRVEKYHHNYPHCWRTDKPVLYYPLESWFIRTTKFKDRMLELNRKINWKPASTGAGRFGNWLENLVDWNVSRSRYWGTPIPIWTTGDGREQRCIGSYDALRAAVDHAIEAGYEQPRIEDDFDPHRPFVDAITLVSESGRPMKRIPEVMDVWFDSGAMPYAQWSYPFKNKEVFAANFPADFIAEGIDQTRGWFFTLHALAVMLFDEVAYRNVMANGLVLDKDGNKMSKRLGNAVDPFETLETYGPDAVRWYMVHNAQPWDNLRFDLRGLDETRRKFFGTLHNTYSFFALYANIDGFRYAEKEVPLAERTELDRWIISLLHSLIAEVEEALERLEPTMAVRAIQQFITDDLSNWYVRLSRRRFWKGEYEADKIAAYQTLYQCLESCARLMAPLAPFYGDWLFQALNVVTGRDGASSVHLSTFPKASDGCIDRELEARMALAQDISSQVLSLRKREQIKVRQPLEKIMIPVLNQAQRRRIREVESLICSEVNVKEIAFIEEEGVLVKSVKPDFKKLGPKLGRQMKAVKARINQMHQEEIARLEQQGRIDLGLPDGTTVELTTDEVEVKPRDIPGFLVSSSDKATVALDITITDALAQEGLVRELVNRIQQMRKEQALEVTDHIELYLEPLEPVQKAVKAYEHYLRQETLTDKLEFSQPLSTRTRIEIDDLNLHIALNKIHNGNHS